MTHGSGVKSFSLFDTRSLPLPKVLREFRVIYKITIARVRTYVRTQLENRYVVIVVNIFWSDNRSRTHTSQLCARCVLIDCDQFRERFACKIVDSRPRWKARECHRRSGWRLPPRGTRAGAFRWKVTGQRNNSFSQLYFGLPLPRVEMPARHESRHFTCTSAACAEIESLMRNGAY